MGGMGGLGDTDGRDWRIGDSGWVGLADDGSLVCPGFLETVGRGPQSAASAGKAWTLVRAGRAASQAISTVKIALRADRAAMKPLRFVVFRPV